MVRSIQVSHATRELSRPMIDRLRAKADEATIPVIVGDMATALAPGTYTLVYLVYNTISNLLTQAEQVACFRNAARHLVPGGRFVIELWVPELRRLPPGQQGVLWQSDPDYIAFDTYDVLQQHLVSHHVRLEENGGARLARSPHRYVWPAELDLMGQLAGFELETRHADYTPTSRQPSSPPSPAPTCPSTASQRTDSPELGHPPRPRGGGDQQAPVATPTSAGVIACASRCSFQLSGRCRSRRRRPV